MARNKYPEETVKLILDVATHLFFEKGYDATSLQDIINETNLSKGAIYHHFSSKEEIFEAIFHRIGEENTSALAKVRDDKSLNGLEKLRAIFKAALFNSNQSLMLTVTPCLLDNPRFLAMQIAQLYQIVAPKFIQPILQQGIDDGSIQATNPGELAEAIRREEELLGGDGRVLVRPSGTEPLIRVMVEAKTTEQAESCAARLVELVKSLKI